MLDSRTVLTWTYDPKGFFEEGFSFDCEGGVLAVGNGEVRGTFDAARYVEGRQFRDTVHQELQSRFLAQQLFICEPFTLSPAAMSRKYSDGRRDVTAFPDTLVLRATFGRPDFIVKDSAGTVVQDSRAERMAARDKFRSDVSTLLPQDKGLKRMLDSFRNAITDGENALVHLYEIREVLSTEFHGSELARGALGISASEWRAFGKLANDEPLLEGRHRGKHTELRHATPEELEGGFDFARRLVIAYVKQRRLNE